MRRRATIHIIKGQNENGGWAYSVMAKALLLTLIYLLLDGISKL